LNQLRKGFGISYLKIKVKKLILKKVWLWYIFLDGATRAVVLAPLKKRTILEITENVTVLLVNE